MELDRRRFLQVCGLAAGSLLAPCHVAMAAPLAAAAPGAMGMLTDLTKCIGCGWCQKACREWNDLTASSESPGRSDPCLSADTWTLPELKQVNLDGETHHVFVKRQCMHCVDPACVSACPVGALQKQDDGAVTYDCTRCIGCRYCMVACPFGIPKFEWEEPLPRIRKCTFCVDRQADGLAPACATVCPTGALTFGERDALIAEAQARIEANPGAYVDHIYGKDELGGTSWLYISPVPFEKLDFPALKSEPVTELSESVATFGTAGVATSVTVLLGGLYYWFNGRKKEIEVQGLDASEGEEEE
ncbi:MAG: 4Fe-4S dicluster domain-containing protein [Anaerolineae bacterium]